MRELTSMETAGVRMFADSGCHPRRIDGYLQDRGYTNDEIDQALANLCISRRELIIEYRRGLRVRSLGGAVSLFGVGAIVYTWAHGSVVVLPVPLIAYGIFMLATGTMTPAKRSEATSHRRPFRR